MSIFKDRFMFCPRCGCVMYLTSWFNKWTCPKYNCTNK